MGDSGKLRILIAEDDDGHAALIQRALRDAGCANPVLRFVNGEDLWDFLRGGPGPGGAESFDPGRPCLVLLDINMPRLNGIEVLGRIRSDEALRGLLVIMLTTTDDPREVRKCYQLGCNAYMTKPAGFSALSEAFERLASFLKVIEV